MELILYYMLGGVGVLTLMEILWKKVPHQHLPLKHKDRIGIFIFWPLVIIAFIIAFVVGLIKGDK